MIKMIILNLDFLEHKQIHRQKKIKISIEIVACLRPTFAMLTDHVE